LGDPLKGKEEQTTKKKKVTEKIGRCSKGALPIEEGASTALTRKLRKKGTSWGQGKMCPRSRQAGGAVGKPPQYIRQDGETHARGKTPGGFFKSGNEGTGNPNGTRKKKRKHEEGLGWH